MDKTEGVTPTQITYLTDLRNRTAADLADRAAKGFDAGIAPRGPLASLVRRIAGTAQARNMAYALKIYKAEWLNATDDDTADTIQERIVEYQSQIARLTDDDIANLSKADASTLISAATVIAGKR